MSHRTNMAPPTRTIQVHAAEACRLSCATARRWFACMPFLFGSATGPAAVADDHDELDDDDGEEDPGRGDAVAGRGQRVQLGRPGFRDDRRGEDAEDKGD